MKNSIPTHMDELILPLKGIKCWYVSCGGAAGSTFQLAFGEKVARSVPLKNPAHDETYRRYQGEFSLLVWCSWRLDSLEAPVTSSDDNEKLVAAGLSQLVGATIESIDVVAPAWDLNVEFSNALVLHVFCDHVPGDPSFDGNWDLFIRDVTVAVGPGARVRIDDRSQVPNRI